MNKWKTKFSHWKFDKKILLLVTVSILIVTLTVAGVSLTFSIASMKEQSVELLQMQNNTVAESFKGSMDSYKEIVLGTIMDDSVQNYCRQVQKNELKTADIDAVYSKLENLNNMYESLNFAAIVSSDYKSYYYRGKGSLSVTQFEEVYPQAYERSKYAQKGTLKVSYNNDYYNDYYKGNRYTLSLYYPLYDTRKVSDARGLLCMNFDDPAVQRMLAVGDSSAETRVVDTGGMILLSNDKEETGRYVNYIDEMEKGIQIFTKNGNMYVCQKIKNWNYYVVSSISFYKLMESGFHIMVVVILVLIMAGMCTQERFFCQFLCPMGAVFALMPILPGALFQRNREKCPPKCGLCKKRCPAHLDIDGDTARSGECLCCHACAATCPRKNIHIGTNEGN